MKLPVASVIAGLVGLALVAPLVEGADGPKAPPIAPEDKARLDALIGAYRALPSYADQGTLKLAVVVGGRRVETTQKASVAFVRPKQVDIQTDLVRVVCDGSTLTTVVVPLKTYQATPAPKKLAESILRGGPLGAVEFGGVIGRPLAHVLNLVIGDEPERLIYDFAPKVASEPDQVEGDATYKVLRLDEAENYDWRFLIDPKSGLLAHVDLVVKGDAAKSSIVGGDTHVESLRWSAGPIAAETPKAEAFAFQPPEGYKAVAKLEQDVKAEDAKPEGAPK